MLQGKIEEEDSSSRILPDTECTGSHGVHVAGTGHHNRGLLFSRRKGGLRRECPCAKGNDVGHWPFPSAEADLHQIFSVIHVAFYGSL